MTTHELAKLLRDRLAVDGRSIYELHTDLSGTMSHQTVYNALAGKPIKSDNLLALFDELGLTVTPTKRKAK